MKRSDALDVWGLGVLGSGQFEDAVYLLWLKIQSLDGRKDRERELE